MLALWRWIATLGGGIPIAVATLTALLGAAGVAGFAHLAGPGRLGGDVAGWWGTVPGHEIIAGPLDGLSKVASWPSALPAVGEWGLGAGIIAIAFLILARVGIGRWSSWDARQRAAARKRVPRQVGGWGPALTFGLLTLVAGLMSVATFAYLWR